MKRTIYLILAGVLATLTGAARTSSNKSEVAQNLNIFNAIYKELQMNYVDSIDAKKSIRNAIDAMLGQIDPYTEYYSAEEQEDLASLASGEFSGIGSIIVQRDGKVVLYQPQWNSPARKAGVRHGDVIIAIDGDTLPKGFTSTEATKLLRGQAGTKVNLTVKRPYVTDSILDIEIIRGKIRTEPVPYYGMMKDGIGYIKLTTFNEKSAADVKNALTELKKDPSLKGIVFDLRGNGGGLLESAVQIAGFFLPKGTEVLRTRYRGSEDEKVYKTSQKPIDTTTPLAFLVDGGTASSSEILAGAMQDLDRAVIIGERSFGKGLVQSTRPLPYDGVLKVTVARYYIPSGRLIQAIDYSHRNPDGTVARIPDSLTNVFHTAAGREVRDGGGITPDVNVKHPEYNRLTYNVDADFWAYDFANRYFALHADEKPDGDTFEVTDTIFGDFKAFIDPDKFKYDRLCESGIKMLREAASQEGYMTDSVAAQFDVLEAMLKHNLEHDLDYNKKELKAILDREISDRYFDDAIMVKRSLKGDPDVEAAIEVLSDEPRYRKLLSK
ncbi:MAG: S41 family peptidase [Muribaculaceae bacterium]|nr:S41 family peptidase [Muribaculaceae bacterium]